MDGRAGALEELGVGEEIKTLSMLKREVEAPSELESSWRLDDGGLKEFKMASRASLPESVREGMLERSFLLLFMRSFIFEVDKLLEN